MADSEVILDKDVRHITGVRLVPALRGPWQVYFDIVFVDGRAQQRPLEDCACPEAIKKLLSDDEDVTSESVGASEEASEADDRHLDDVPSDDSIWETMEDSQGRRATSPTVRAAIRARASVPDETFRTPSKEGSRDGSSSQSSSSATTVEPTSATKSAGSETSDSLLVEIAASGVAVSNSPGNKRPTRDTACRGVALRRYATRRRLFALSDDDDLFDDGTKDDGFSPNKSMAQLKVKDGVVDSGFGKQEREDVDRIPGAVNLRLILGHSLVPAPEKPRSAIPSSMPIKKVLGVIGNMLGEYFSSQASPKECSLPSKQVKVEPVSDDDNGIRRASHGRTAGVKRKRHFGQAASPSPKARAIEVVTLSDDDDEVPRAPAKKAKKSEKVPVIYELSSDSDDTLGAHKP
ncbi:hypothetical protein AAVH_14854 [Aphelenchoides avenae]|nr:hypothetical protein AAVH_14854 [Aphelenchus avenae]